MTKAYATGGLTTGHIPQVSERRKYPIEKNKKNESTRARNLN
jgi:hypothetical protein